LMNKSGINRKTHTQGFSLVEIILAVSILAMSITFTVGAVIFGQQSMAIAASRNRAVFIAEEGLEAVRNIRNRNFSNLSSGTYDVQINNNRWQLTTPGTQTDGFARTITIDDIDSDRKKVTSEVEWPQTLQRTGKVTLVTYLTNNQDSTGDITPEPASTCAQYCQSIGTYSTGTCRANTNQCRQNTEKYEPGGDTFCTGGPSADTCCCKP